MPTGFDKFYFVTYCVSILQSRAVQVDWDADVEAEDVQGGEESRETHHWIGLELPQIREPEFRRFSG